MLCTHTGAADSFQTNEEVASRRVRLQSRRRVNDRQAGSS